MVRFRSVPGTAKEIGTIFLAMASGLMFGMGFIGYGILFTVIMCGVMLLLTVTGVGTHKKPSLDKTLRITMPEDLNYGDAFDDIFEKYTTNVETVTVKTTNMGSLYKITYNLTLKNQGDEKAFMDELRCRNGNLEIVMSR